MKSLVFILSLLGSLTSIPRLCKIPILLLALIPFFSFGQVNLCGEKVSDFPIDRQLYEIRDSLVSSGVDTIIIYSHWISTNGFNGYGKAQWIKNGEVYLLKLIHDKESSSIKRDEVVKLSSDSIITFFFKNSLDTIKTNPTQQEIGMSHDGRHFVEINWAKGNHCFIMPNLLVQFNPNNKRAQLINMLKDKSTDVLTIDGVRTKGEGKYKLDRRWYFKCDSLIKPEKVEKLEFSSSELGSDYCYWDLTSSDSTINFGNIGKYDGVYTVSKKKWKVSNDTLFVDDLKFRIQKLTDSVLIIKKIK